MIAKIKKKIKGLKPEFGKGEPKPGPKSGPKGGKGGKGGIEKPYESGSESESESECECFEEEEKFKKGKDGGIKGGYARGDGKDGNASNRKSKGGKF